LRCTVVGEANIDFFMLVPAVPVLTPILENSYPDGLHPFEATNSFTFTVGAANGAGIPESGVSLIVDGQNVTSGLTLTGATNSWTGSFPITSNTIYTATISVSNSAGLISSFALNFDTFDVNSFQWEANDYDYSTNNGTAWISGLFIDNPVPTCDINATATGHEATNSYFGYPGGVLPDLENASNGAAAQSGIDFFDQGPQPIASGTDDYRRDGDGSQVTGDYLRPKFIAAQKQFNDPNIGPYQIGYTTSGDWQNYTRHYPSGKFTLYADCYDDYDCYDDCYCYDCYCYYYCYCYYC
jgi:hypothetical protein